MVRCVVSRGRKEPGLMDKGTRETDLSSGAGTVFTQPGKAACSRHQQGPVTRHAQAEAHSHVVRQSRETRTTDEHL